MKTDKITVDIKCRRKRKARTWLYALLLKTLCMLGVINGATALGKLESYCVKSTQVKIGGNKWTYYWL